MGKYWELIGDPYLLLLDPSVWYLLRVCAVVQPRRCRHICLDLIHLDLSLIHI